MKTAKILGAVDGTGPFNNSTYKAEFKNSFVNKVGNFFVKKTILRGPSADGIKTDSQGKKIANYVKRECNYMSQPTVFLSGYSRGGAAVIHAAKLLARDGIDVEAMFLFDAVERTIAGSNTSKIPKNVKFCYHALRDPKANSRSYFSNTGRNLKDNSYGTCTPRGNTLTGGSTVYLEKTFFGTHGAIGGLPQLDAGKDGFIDETPAVSIQVPHSGLQLGVNLLNAALNKDTTNITPSQNLIAKQDVWTWMQTNIHKHVNKGVA